MLSKDVRTFEGHHRNGCRSFWFSICFCSELTQKMFAHICMLSQTDSSFFLCGVSSEGTGLFPRSGRSRVGREADSPENYHTAFQYVLIAVPLPLLRPLGRERDRASYRMLSCARKVVARAGLCLVGIICGSQQTTVDNISPEDLQLFFAKYPWL